MATLPAAVLAVADEAAAEVEPDWRAPVAITESNLVTAGTSGVSSRGVDLAYAEALAPAATAGTASRGVVGQPHSSEQYCTREGGAPMFLHSGAVCRGGTAARVFRQCHSTPQQPGTPAGGCGGAVLLLPAELAQVQVAYT